MHLGKLKNIQVFLSIFDVGKSSESGIQQLGELSLRGDLLITGLENIVNPVDALAADLTHLRRLELEWKYNRNLVEDSVKEREVLENLKPSRHLEKLSIRYYGGTQLPSWLSDNSLSNVVSLSLEICKYCLCLPSLGLLPLLKDLRISKLDGIVSIDADFYGSISSSFTSLETLNFFDMKEWEEWNCKDVTGAFPRLRSLSMVDCPKLKGHLHEQFFHLKSLQIHGCKQLVASAPMFQKFSDFLLSRGTLQTGHIMSDTSLESLHIYSCPKVNILINSCFNFLVRIDICDAWDRLTTFPLDFFPKLSGLAVSRCNLRMISQGHTHNHLKYLTIDACPQFESFLSEGLSAPRLERFSIKELDNLKSLPKHMHVLLPSLNYMSIHNCPYVESFSDGGLPSNLKEMNLSNCSKLFVSMKGALGANNSVETLCIQEMNVESFPDEGLLPLSLASLKENWTTKVSASFTLLRD